jgi:hypothetical protein
MLMRGVLGGRKRSFTPARLPRMLAMVANSGSPALIETVGRNSDVLVEKPIPSIVFDTLTQWTQ